MRDNNVSQLLATKYADRHAWFTCEYFAFICDTLVRYGASALVDEEDIGTPGMQLGRAISEKADLVLLEPRGCYRAVRKAALTAVTEYAKLWPKEFLEHIDASRGTFSWRGLLNIEEKDVWKFWTELSQRHVEAFEFYQRWFYQTDDVTMFREMLRAAGIPGGTQEPVLSSEAILESPATSYWLKDALKAALKRDPVDAANDAEVLARLLSDRAKEMLDDQEPKGGK